MLDLMIKWENGEATDEETLTLFSELIRTGQCWTLQGCYGRFASRLIDAKCIDRTGKILIEV